MSDADPTPADAGAPAAGATAVREEVVPPTTAPPARRRSFGSTADMVRSLAVVFVLIALILVLTPRSHEEQVRTVDWRQTYGQAVLAARYPVYGPVGLPTRWRATSARTSVPAGSTLAWHVGFVTPTEHYAAVEQRDGTDTKYLRDLTGGGRADGTSRIAGRTWQRLQAASGAGPVRSLLLPGKASTVVVTGTASYAELDRLASSLRAR